MTCGNWHFTTGYLGERTFIRGTNKMRDLHYFNKILRAKKKKWEKIFQKS
jgi:hypothetical protein